MSIRYGQKIATLSDKEISSSYLGYNRDVRVKSPHTNNDGVYSRPGDYLTIPSITSSDEKVVSLVFISNDESNFLAFTASGNYTVDWGDGSAIESIGTGQTGIASHAYNYTGYDTSGVTLNSGGYKQALLTITPQSGASLTSLNFQTRYPSYSGGAGNYYSQPIAELYISCPNLTSLTLGTPSPTTTIFPRFISYANLINIGNLANLTNAFRGMYSLMRVDVGKTSASLTNMTSMFTDCRSLEMVAFNNETNTSNVTTTSAMFSDCYHLKNVPLFDTSNVTNMSSMFDGCRSLTNIPFFNTSKVTNMSSMFLTCSSLKEVPLFDTSKVTNMASTFQSCVSLETVPLFDTLSVTTMGNMFNGCTNLTTVPLFNTSSVTAMNNMFESCSSLKTIPLFNTENVTNMGTMFRLCGDLVKIPLFNTIKVTSMASMFSNCTSLESVPLFNTIAVITMNNMFNGCSNLKTVPLFNTSNVGTDMISMFEACISLITVPLFNTENVTSMSSMFASCVNLIEVPLFNTSKVTNMAGMFSNCYNLANVPLFNTENVTSMANMFQNCYSLNEIPLFNTIKVTTLASFLSACFSLKTVPEFNLAAATTLTSMLNSCYSLSKVPALNANAATVLTTMFTNCFSLASNGMYNVKYTVDFTNNKLSKEALETIFANLGTATVGATRTITITGNWGAPTPINLTGTLTSGSVTISMANTAGLVTGMQVTGTNTSLTTGRAVTFTDVGDLVTLNSHGLSNGDEVSFSTITSTTGIVINTIYYVVGSTTNTFQVASSVGGSALPLTTNGSGTVKYNSTIVSIVPNTSVTMSRPMAGGSAQTLSFRTLGTYKAILKGFTVTG